MGEGRIETSKDLRQGGGGQASYFYENTKGAGGGVDRDPHHISNLIKICPVAGQQRGKEVGGRWYRRGRERAGIR